MAGARKHEPARGSGRRRICRRVQYAGAGRHRPARSADRSRIARGRTMKRDPIGLEGAHPTARPDRPFFARSIGATFEISALVGEGGAEIDLYDEIGFFGVSAKAFRERLNAIDADRILLRINSPGGDVFDGIAIYNDLVAHRAEVR